LQGPHQGQSSNQSKAYVNEHLILISLGLDLR